MVEALRWLWMSTLLTGIVFAVVRGLHDRGFRRIGCAFGSRGGPEIVAWRRLLPLQRIEIAVVGTDLRHVRNHESCQVSGKAGVLETHAPDHRA